MKSGFCDQKSMQEMGWTQVEQGFSSFLPNFFHFWWVFKVPQKKKNEEKSCLTCIQPLQKPDF